MNTIKLRRFNGEFCENLYANIILLDDTNIKDVENLYNRVSNSLSEKNWLKSRSLDYLQNMIKNNGFIIGCYVNDLLIASALCETPTDDYVNYLSELGFNDKDINSIYTSGYVMVDPLYRGNGLQGILLEKRIDESIARQKKYLITAVAVENVISLRTILSKGFNIKFQKQNHIGITRHILLKDLNTSLIEVTA